MNTYAKLQSIFELWKQGRKNTAKSEFDSLPVEFRKKLQEFVLLANEEESPDWKFVDFQSPDGNWTLSCQGEIEGKAVVIQYEDLRTLCVDILLHES